MIDLLHNFHPSPLLISFGNVKIYWYGLFVVSGILAAVLVALKLAGKYSLNKDRVIDSIFWLIITGLVGARLYHVFLEWEFYLKNPFDIIKIWQGGLAIHGGIIAGIITLLVVAKKYGLDAWLLASIYVPGLALAQAIGRRGNYFNQELFGKPTELPWGIPIDPANRIPEFYNSQFFQPTFLYESIGNLAIFFILIYLHKQKFKIYPKAKSIVFSYLMLYSLLRFCLEFVRVDKTIEIGLLRWPQIISLIIIIISFIFLFNIRKKIQTLPK